MSEQELIRAIRDNVDDDGPRLVFADWLTEHAWWELELIGSAVHKRIAFDEYQLSSLVTLTLQGFQARQLTRQLEGESRLPCLLHLNLLNDPLSHQDVIRLANCAFMSQLRSLSIDVRSSRAKAIAKALAASDLRHDVCLRLRCGTECVSLLESVLAERFSNLTIRSVYHL